MLTIPSTGDVVDLTLDGRQERLLRVRSVVSSQLLLRHISQLHRLGGRPEIGRHVHGLRRSNSVIRRINEHAAHSDTILYMTTIIARVVKNAAGDSPVHAANASIAIECSPISSVHFVLRADTS